MTDDITRAYDAFRAEHFGGPLIGGGISNIEVRWHRLYFALEQLPDVTLHAFIAIADAHEPAGSLMRTLPRLIAEARAEEPACRSCKHWAPLPDQWNDDPLERFGYVHPKGGGKVPWSPDSGICGKAKLPDDNHAVDPMGDAQMFVQDGSGYEAMLVTKAAFYCAHFEAKP